VRVTHRFHPQSGPDFDFVAHRQNRGEDRVHLRDENSGLFCLPGGWTEVAPAGPYVVIAEGCCPFTIDGLLALADLIGPLRSQARVRQEPSATGQRRHCPGIAITDLTTGQLRRRRSWTG